ncbi:TonB-dependent receptor [Salegentibacter sp. HM20]
MKTVLFFAGLLLLSLPAISQTYTLEGQVTRNDQALPQVSIIVENSNQGTQTGPDGNYSLQLEEGSYKITFVFGNRVSREVDLTENRVLNVDLGSSREVLDEVFLSSVRVNAESPITYSNLSSEEIEQRNLGQDIPILMNYMPNVVSTSDAGAGVGYTGIRVRGSDATRVNVTINGIPYNDAESQGSFWVNLGDFASSVESLQLQRGVGTSTNGAGAFGASLNILTDGHQEEASAELANSVGSFNTRKHTLKFSTGLLNGNWEFAGRASQIKSDGYIDRASSDLKSYFLQASYVDDNTLVKALTFGGSERTYQAWYGIDAETLATNRRYNPAGEYVDPQGNTRFYENQTDNYKQDHYQLLWNQKYDDNWSSNFALHYTYGRGYYEEFEQDASLEEFGLSPFMAEGDLVTNSDLVGTKWLDNHFYGTTYSLNYEEDTWDVTLGGGWNRYIGDHFGEVIYTRFARNNEPYEPYYENVAYKNDFNIYGKTNFAINEKLAAYIDLQYRRVTYETEGVLSNQNEFLVDDEMNFFNPKTGLTYKFDDRNRLYVSFARAHREPSRRDYENGNPEPEELNDYELGWRFNSSRVKLNTNLYFMDYRNQLVLTGGIDEVGSFVRENSGKSYRLGLEIDATINLAEKFVVRPNLAWSRNQNIDFVSTWDGELVDFGNTEISYSPSVVAGNIFTYLPTPNWNISLLSKYVSSQYMSNIEAENSKLDSYFINDFNVQYTLRDFSVFKEVLLTGLVNNIFGVEYVSNGYYYTFDIPNEQIPSGLQTLDGAGYYPQATTNFLVGVTLKF